MTYISNVLTNLINHFIANGIFHFDWGLWGVISHVISGKLKCAVHIFHFEWDSWSRYRSFIHRDFFFPCRGMTFDTNNRYWSDLISNYHSTWDAVDYDHRPPLSHGAPVARQVCGGISTGWRISVSLSYYPFERINDIPLSHVMISTHGIWNVSHGS